MSCSVKGCTNTKRFKPEGITFHRFPRGEMLKVWLEILQLPPDWQWTPNKRICSKHLKPTDFIKSDNRRRLKFNAVPSPPLSPPITVETDSGQTPSTSCKENISTLISTVVSDILESTDSSSLSGVKSGKTMVSSSSEADSKRKKVKGETSSSTDSCTKRKLLKLIHTFHSYSISPEKIKRKYQALQDTQLKSRKKLYAARKLIKTLRRNITSLKIVVDDLRRNQSQPHIYKFE